MSKGAAQVASVGRRLSRHFNPLDLYTVLTAAGRRDTFLFQSEDEVSLIMPNAAMRIECRGETVTLAALTANGESLLALIEDEFAGQGISRSARTLVIHIPHVPDHDAGRSLVAPAPLHVLRTITGLSCAPGEHRFAASVLGVIAFDHAARREGLPDGGQADPLDFPDFIFWVPESLILFERSAPPHVLCSAFGPADSDAGRRNFNDSVDRLAVLVARCGDIAPARSAPSIAPVAPQAAPADLDDRQFREVVGRLKREIVAGEIYQIVPSRTFRQACPDPLGAFAALSELEKSPYRFFVDAGGWSLFGASPETSVRTMRGPDGTRIEVRPIAGTRPRGATADEDDRMEAALRLDEKELAEHMMLVDLARNDVARVSKPGSRRADALLGIKRHARVMHLESSVTGLLRDGLDCLDALTACLNVGTLTGAPKRRASEILRRIEVTRRGPYGGAIGWINLAGEMDTSVIIRSAVVQDGVAHVRAGAGVVFDSDPQAECDETRHKASMLLSVLGAMDAAA